MASNFANQVDEYIRGHNPNPLSDLNNISVSTRIHILLTYLTMQNVGDGEKQRVGPATNDIRNYMIKRNGTTYMMVCSPFIEGYYEVSNEMLDQLLTTTGVSQEERRAYTARL